MPIASDARQIAAESRKAFAEELALFHHLIFNASKNKLYAILFGSFHDLITTWTEQMFPDWRQYDTVTIRRIYQSIKDRNPIKAECMMTAYITTCAERLEKLA